MPKAPAKKPARLCPVTCPARRLLSSAAARALAEPDWVAEAEAAEVEVEVEAEVEWGVAEVPAHMLRRSLANRPSIR